jgi:hypothetical protein
MLWQRRAGQLFDRLRLRDGEELDLRFLPLTPHGVKYEKATRVHRQQL